MTRPGSIAHGAALALTALLLAAAPALAATRLGTENGETLTGTHNADTITGNGGDDLLKGLAGDDTYRFGNNWGTDTISDKAAYEVRGKTRPGGVDTLDFSAVTSQSVQSFLVPSWGADANIATLNTTGGYLKLGSSKVENVVGTPFTSNFDSLSGGAGPNRLDTGGGGADELYDYGGWDDPSGEFPTLPPSSDTFAGAAANTGTVQVADWGGRDDRLDLRPLPFDQVSFAAIDRDGTPASKESLRILTGTSPTAAVVVLGQFGDFAAHAPYGQRGQIETFRFADRTLTAKAVATLVAITPPAAEPPTAKTKADQRRDFRPPPAAPDPETGSRPGGQDGGDGAGRRGDTGRAP